jgi:hypothetical protein
MKKIILVLTVLSLLIGSFSFVQKVKGMMEEEKDIIQEMPGVTFLQPQEGDVLTGEIKIVVQVSEVSSVEFYLRRPESLIEIYLGKAHQSKEDIWEYLWDTTQTPNGDYYLFPKLMTKYGEYSDSGIGITVDNPIQIDEEEEESLEAEIMETEEEIKEEEEQITQTESETEEEIQKTMESSVQETQETLEEEEKEMIETEISEELEESTKELEKHMEELTEKVKEEVKAPEEEKEKIQKEKEEIKKEIIKKALQPLEVIEKVAKEDVKHQILEKKKGLEEKIKSHLEEMEREILERERARLERLQKLLKDSDGDELPDHEEVRLGTSILNPDTDGDGFLDGHEIALGFDPLRPSPADKIIYQDPRKVESKEADIYKVERVEGITSPTGELIGIKFEGTGRPNSFVTLYIASPSFLVLTTKTDENGRWVYILDKPLEDGEHEIYVALTNNHGEITARSEVFKFIKTPTAVAAIKPPAEGEKVTSPAEAIQRTALLLLIAVVILAIGIALVIIGFLVKKGKKEIKSEI